MGQQRLSSHVDQPALEAELLLSFVLQKTRTYLLTWPAEVCTQADQVQFETFIAKRHAGEPIAYLLAEKAFWDIHLTVTPDVLIPRPETEVLVEAALSILADCPQAQVADLGTGSGAIACALANARPTWSLLATDASDRALQLAKSNATRLALNNITFAKGHWCDALPDRVFDLILSNPPYIAANDEHLLLGDVRFEPQTALVSGADGLEAIRDIIQHAPAYLTSGGFLLLEHGFLQGELVRQILTKKGFREIKTLQDLSGHDRVTQGCVSS